MFWFCFFAIVFLILFGIVSIIGFFMNLFLEYPIQFIVASFALIIYVLSELAS